MNVAEAAAAAEGMPLARPAPSVLVLGMVGEMEIAATRDAERAEELPLREPEGCAQAPPGDVLDQLLRLGSTMQVKRGEMLLRAGDPWTHLFVVKSGVLVTRVRVGGGHARVSDFSYAREFLGLGDAHCDDMSVEAAVHSVIWRVPRVSMVRLAHAEMRVGAWLNEEVARKLAQARDHAVLLSCRTAQQRLARFLVAMARRQHWDTERGEVVWLPISQIDIGDYLGVSAETVCRTLAQFRREGSIGARRRHFIPLLAPRRLAEIAGGNPA